MCRPESSQFSLGPPLIAVHVLSHLRDLLNVWHTASNSERPPCQPSLKEGIDEAIREETDRRQLLLPVGDNYSCRS